MLQERIQTQLTALSTSHHGYWQFEFTGSLCLTVKDNILRTPPKWKQANTN